MTDTERAETQRELVNQLVHSIARTWAGPMPVDMADRYEAIGARLAGVVHSLFVNLRGHGGIQPHRLSPKGQPAVDFFDLPWSLEHAYPIAEEKLRTLEPQAAVDFLRTVEGAANDVEGAAFRSGSTHREAINDFLLTVCTILERGYELVPLIFDTRGNFVREAGDIAPGLAEAFAPGGWAVIGGSGGE
jgi:hypothetical protein